MSGINPFRMELLKSSSLNHQETLCMTCHGIIRKYAHCSHVFTTRVLSTNAADEESLRLEFQIRSLQLLFKSR